MDEDNDLSIVMKPKLFILLPFGRALSDSPESTGVPSVSSLIKVSIRGNLFSLPYQGRKKLLAATLYLKSVFKKKK